MLDKLMLLHAPRSCNASVPQGLMASLPFSPTLDDNKDLKWHTCLRQIFLMQRNTHAGTTQSSTQNFGQTKDTSGYELYRAEQAYQFLLEIICGLHSPLLGETEVLGQFREFVLATHFPENHWGVFLRKLTNDLMRDAKRIRQQYLQHLGHRSYGSHAGQYLQGLPVIGVLGAGQLVAELAPWLVSHADVRVYARNPARAGSTLMNVCVGNDARLQTLALNGSATQFWPDGQSGLVIAAPLTAQEIGAWIERQGTCFKRILDLRGEAVHDPLPKAFLTETEVMDLQEFFASLKLERQHAEKCAAAALVEIKKLAQRQWQQTQCRPYGWEDLCA